MISILYGLYKLALFIIIYNKGSQVLQVNTIFIWLSAQGAYLIFGFSGWALIRGGRLFEVGAYSKLGTYWIFTIFILPYLYISESLRRQWVFCLSNRVQNAEERTCCARNIQNADTKQGYCHEVWAGDTRNPLVHIIIFGGWALIQGWVP